MKQVSRDQARINRAVSKRKKWLQANYPLCILCGHKVREGGDLVHLIRKSNAIPEFTRFQLQTLDLNTWLGHRDCHDIFDNDPDQAVLLPQFDLVMDLIKQMSPEVHSQLMINVYDQKITDNEEQYRMVSA